MPPSIRTIRRHYERGTLEVEHLLDITKAPDPAIGESLSVLASELAWPSVEDALRRSNARTAVIPWGGWADVVADYCRGGFPALVSRLQDRNRRALVLAVCETVKSPESLAFLLSGVGRTISAPSEDIQVSREIASTLNVMLSFKPLVVPTAPQQEVIRRFLEGLALAATDQDARAVAYCALRQVGDGGSIEIIDSLPRLTGPWTSVAQETRRTIMKRIRSEGRGSHG